MRQLFDHRRGSAAGVAAHGLFSLLCMSLVAITPVVAVAAPAPPRDGPVVKEKPADDAQRITFVLHLTDAGSPPTVGRQVGKALDGLRPTQSFDIVVVGPTGSAVRWSAQGLQNATPEAKVKAGEFVAKLKPTKGDNPLPAIAVGLKDKPDLLYFLTDAKALRKDVTAERVEQLNVGRSKVNTVLFEHFTDGVEAVLKTIAGRSGGTYRLVRAKDIG